MVVGINWFTEYADCLMHGFGSKSGQGHSLHADLLESCCSGVMSDLPPVAKEKGRQTDSTLGQGEMIQSIIRREKKEKSCPTAFIP